MNWQTIDTFPYPTEEWDFTTPSYLFFDSQLGCTIGVCILTDKEDKHFSFQYGYDAHKFKPTHWMPLPKAPE